MNKKITLTNIIMLCAVLIAAAIVLTACNGENEMPEPDYEYAQDNELEEIELEDFDEPKPAAEFSMDIAEDFLSQFISIFSLGIHIDGNFYNWDDWRRDLQYALQLSSPPLVYIELDDGRRTQDHNWYNGWVFDKYGYLIPDDAIFLHSGLIANSFAFYDLDEDGIPEILVSFSALSVGFDILYRFIDGEYQAAQDTFGWLRFYRDKDGSIIALTPDHGELFVTHINLLPDSTEVEHLVTISDGDPDAEFDMSNKIPVARLTGLEEEITASIKEQLNIWTDLGIVRIPPDWGWHGDVQADIAVYDYSSGISLLTGEVSDITNFISQFESSEPFDFYEGGWGLMLTGHTDPRNIVTWLRPDLWRTLTFFHSGDFDNFAQNEELILSVVRTFGGPPVDH